MLEQSTYEVPTSEELSSARYSTNNHPFGCSDPFCSKCSDSELLYVNPHCKRCGGYGYYYSVMTPEGNPVPNSLRACDSPGCHVVNWNNRQTTITLKQPQQFSVAKELKTFDTFVTVRDMKKDKVLEDLKYKMEHFANGEGKPIILIYGGVGVGKTHILSAVLKVVATQNVPARLYNAPDMFAWLKQGFDDKVDTYDNRKKFVKELTYLLIDDIKAERMSDWEWEQLESIFDYRTKQEILPTVFSSNNDKGDMSFRLIDRFTDKSICEVIKLDLPSFRGLKK